MVCPGYQMSPSGHNGIQLCHYIYKPTTQVEQPVPMDPTEPHTGIHKIIDLSRYSTLTKLLCVTGYVLRFINNLRDSTAKQTGN